MKHFKGVFHRNKMNVYWNWVPNKWKYAVSFKINVFWPDKKAETVFHDQTEEDLQIPQCISAFQTHTHDFKPEPEQGL